MTTSPKPKESPPKSLYSKLKTHRILHSIRFPSARLREPFGSIFKGQEAAIVTYCTGLLDDPVIEPIGEYQWAGIRRFIWQDIHWQEYSLALHKLLAELECLAAQDWTDHTGSDATTLRIFLLSKPRYPAFRAKLLWKCHEQ